MIEELNSNPKKYLENATSFRNLISNYECSFREDFMDTVYAKHSKDMRTFCETSQDLISKLDTHYDDSNTLDSYLRKISNRIDEARSMPLAARKYVETHRTSCKDINNYLQHMDEKMAHELDGKVNLIQNFTKKL